MPRTMERKTMAKKIIPGDPLDLVSDARAHYERERADDNGVLLDQIETLARVAGEVDYEFSGGRRNDVVNLLYVIERLAKDRK
jgi:hypothetical protein